MRKILITGARGFIGSNFIKYWLKYYPTDVIIDYDAVTYAARRPLVDDCNIVRIKGCVTDQALLERVMKEYNPDFLVHMAAESHVCRSINGPVDFFKSNAMGTFAVLEAWRQHTKLTNKRMVYVSTDEVFGELDFNDDSWSEKSPLAPRSPYSASKAAGDMMAMAYFHTYGLNVCITNASNNFGPNQHEEKLIPKTIKNLLQGKPVTIHGTGKNVRDWIYVEDHCRAIETILFAGQAGQRYCVGGELEMTNIQVVYAVHRALKNLLPSQIGDIVIEYTNDRPTDDKRYSMKTDLLRSLGCNPRPQEFDKRLADTCEWYFNNGFGK